VVKNDDFTRTRDGHFFALGVGDIAHGQFEAHRTGRLGFHRAGHRRARSRTADVEGTHRKLRAGFTDRLSGNDTDRLALADHRAATQVAAVAMSAQAVTGFAGKRRADLDFVHAQAVNVVDQV